jgi:hypothetical protein
MAETPRLPSDETPVTWGELRHALKLISDYHTYLALFTTVGLGTAMGSSNANERWEETEADVRAAAKAVLEFTGYDPTDEPNG